MRIINRFGEIYYEKNEAIVTMPFNRLTIEEPELLEENYINKIKELEYPDTFVYAEHFSSIRDRLQMSYDLNECVDFQQIHKYKLKDMIPFLYSMIDIAKQDANILWQKQNMVLDLNEQRVKAILFAFDGFTIYKKDNSVDGLKQLILLSLTSNNNIIAKPKRADFIEKTDEVFQFSNDILASRTIEDIENVINAYEREIEYQRIKKEQELAEKRNNSKLFALKEKIIPKKKELSPDDQMKQALREQASSKDEQRGSTSSNSFIDKITTPKSMISIIIGVLILGIVFTQTDFTTGATSEDEELKKEVTNQNEITEAYRLYINGDEDSKNKAYAKLDSIGYENLEKEDQDVLLNWYIEQKQYTKALKLNPSSDVSVVDAIRKEHDDNIDATLSELETLESSFPEQDLIKFEMGLIEEDYARMTENSHITKYNEERAKEIVKAHVLTNEVEELNNLIDDYKDSEDEKSYENLQSQYDKYFDKYSQQQEIKEEIQAIKNNLSDKEDKLKGTKKKKDKKKLKKEISTIKKDLKKQEEKLNKKEEDIKNDD